MEKVVSDLKKFQQIFFIGVAGAGMSALAQYLAGSGFRVSGSDRYFQEGEANETKQKLEAAGILCFPQNASGINESTELIVVSTAVEETVPEVQKARAQNIPIIKRSDLLALIADMRRTIAVGGTSGKSTVSAMIWHIMNSAGLKPGIISGAGLVSLIEEGQIGNAATGNGDWLVIEADESDGSIVKYHPEIGLLLNIDKDHMDLPELNEVFTTFRNNTKGSFITNRSQAPAKTLSVKIEDDFSTDENPAGFTASDFRQTGFKIEFEIHGTAFLLNSPGRHNMENAVAAAAAVSKAGVSLSAAAKALKTYKGIYRRHQILGSKNGVTVIDDYAHNPAKCAASIRACQPLAKKLIAWFQPHGYGPTKFLRLDFADEISKALRPHDEIWMSEIFYAGGTAVKDISAADLIADLKNRGQEAFFIENRNHLLSNMRSHFSDETVLLLMGARDPGLEHFTKQLFEEL